MSQIIKFRIKTKIDRKTVLKSFDRLIAKMAAIIMRISTLFQGLIQHFQPHLIETFNQDLILLTPILIHMINYGSKLFILYFMQL